MIMANINHHVTQKAVLSKIKKTGDEPSSTLSESEDGERDSWIFLSEMKHIQRRTREQRTHGDRNQIKTHIGLFIMKCFLHSHHVPLIGL